MARLSLGLPRGVSLKSSMSVMKYIGPPLERQMSSSSFSRYLRCLCLVPYSLACICLFFFGALEWLARYCLPCISLNGSGLLAIRMRVKLSEQLKVSGICQAIWRFIIHILCPSVLMRECSEFKNYAKEGDKEVKEMKYEISMCNDLLLILRGERLERLKQAVSPSACRESRDTYTEQFFLRLDKCQRLEHHMDTLKKNAEERRISSRTRAAAEHTGYHGIVDWAERTSQTYVNLLDITAKVAFVGAGLTYGSIFSASRGNIGLMCYAFALFDCGFIIPTVALALLKWASSRPKDTLFCSPRTWTLILNIFTYFSVAAVGAAICLLNMTLYLLVFPRNSSGKPTDGTLQLNISPTPAGSLSLGCLLLSTGIVLTCALTHYLAHGKNAFIQDFIGHRLGQTREQDVQESTSPSQGPGEGALNRVFQANIVEYRWGDSLSGLYHPPSESLPLTY